ncbi:MAG TPA: nucleotide pyrophosphohydrolase [Thermoanaerobacterales bacterium]|uniref:MazG-like family protein n=1 Tax=Tepidanaerobacter sp. GT38 TaxID=2722793 RepID=UPI0017901200|nr:MazG-like family protein [Tepidanaerobacter sp. GT38]MCG1012599.1 MazG-like family protein [Tepidanaerobacter sp. GT38]HHY42445.1 nucleotide pyrophosphohydrolase [Thermoanaerobacterales bacterium]
MKHDSTYKVISLPKLNGLTPTLESTALKLMEEAGELAQAIGKFRGQSGEAIRMEEEKVVDMMAQELLDVAQVAVSMMFVLEENYNIDINAKLKQHLAKLKAKGYIK